MFKKIIIMSLKLNLPSDKKPELKLEDVLNYLKKVAIVAKVNNLLVDPQKLLDVINNNFQCLCRINTPCPCPYMKKDIEKQGYCLCRLFYKKG